MGLPVDEGEARIGAADEVGLPVDEGDMCVGAAAEVGSSRAAAAGSALAERHLQTSAATAMLPPRAAVVASKQGWWGHRQQSTINNQLKSVMATATKMKMMTVTLGDGGGILAIARHWRRWRRW